MSAKENSRQSQLNPARIRRLPGLRWLGDRLSDGILWKIDKKRVARGASVGLFTSWFPIPFQMILAVPLAVFCRANVPAAIAFVWLSNPLTWLPMLALAYEVGFFILKPEKHYLTEITSAENLSQAIQSILPDALGPILLGGVILQIVTATLGYALVVWFWEWVRKFMLRLSQSRE